MRTKRTSLVLLVALFSMLLSPLAASAAFDPPDPSQSDEKKCNGQIAKMADQMGLECSELLDYQAAGVGLGVIKQAYSMSESNWRDLVETHMSGEGAEWGELKKAYSLAGQLDLSAEELLGRHAEGVGWGEILQEHRVGPGKPPWANGPPPWVRRGKPSWARTGHGRPNWAGPKDAQDEGAEE
jgi:hypothetical protein